MPMLGARERGWQSGHGGTEAVSFVKKELPKLLGKERDPNPRERLRQALDEADRAMSEHFQKEGESNSDYGLSSGACACVALHEGLQWPTLATVTRFAAKEAHPRSSL